MTSASQEWVPFAQTFEKDFKFPDVKARVHKTYLISDQNGQILYPISDQNGSKPLPFGASHTYSLSDKGLPSPPGL